MQSCLDTDLLTSRATGTSLPAIDLWQGWTHSVRAPRNPQKSLVQSLAGVPRAALRTIFNRTLAQKIWQSTRPLSNSAAEAQPGVPPTAKCAGQLASIPDHEILGEMIDHLAAQAAQTLHQRSRQARAVRLQFVDALGAVSTARALFAYPTSAAEEIRATAQSLLLRPRTSTDQLASVNLNVETLAPDLPQQPIN
jgi:nucleotidyltransferase/DNA polymerase involved in DNA repair